SKILGSNNGLATRPGVTAISVLSSERRNYVGTRHCYRQISSFKLKSRFRADKTYEVYTPSLTFFRDDVGKTVWDAERYQRSTNPILSNNVKMNANGRDSQQETDSNDITMKRLETTCRDDNYGMHKQNETYRAKSSCVRRIEKLERGMLIKEAIPTSGSHKSPSKQQKNNAK
ncbi:7295_t:CDS:2, partial [Ambispora gerdemannii]